MLRNDEPNKAKNCLYLGIILGTIGIITNFLVTDYNTYENIDININ